MKSVYAIATVIELQPFLGMNINQLRHVNVFEITGGKDIVFGNYGPAWMFHRKLFTTVLRKYLSDIALIERRVSTQTKKLVHFMEEQNGKPFDPADCLQRAVADVICGITFGDGYDTSNPDLRKLLQLNVDLVANTDDAQLVTVLENFTFVKYLPLKAYNRLVKAVFETYDIIRKFLKERKTRSKRTCA